MNPIFTRKKLFLPVLMATTAIAGISAAQAQIETVVVTAEKRTEDLQKVPMNITVLGDKALQQLEVTHFDDYAKFLPSVDYQTGGPGFAQVYIRGVASGENGNHSGPLPSVGQYLDEQPITTIGGALDIHVYDIARVEALSGPQGTLYGASSEAGTIRIITNKPDTDAFSASYDVEANAVAHGGAGYTVEGFVNIPLSDKMAVRLVAWDEHDSGYIDNTQGTNLSAGILNGVRTFPTASIYSALAGGGPVTSDNAAVAKKNINSVDTIGGRAALKIDLNANWTVTPSIIVQRAASNGIFAYDPGVGFLQYTHALQEYSNDSWYQAALTLEGKVGNLDLTYAGAYMDRWLNTKLDYADYSYFYDTLNAPPAAPSYYALDSGGNYIDPSQWIWGRDEFTKTSHELRLASPSDDRLRFIGGLFSERQTHFIEQRYVVANSDIVNGLPAVTGFPSTIWLTEQMRVDRDYAAFGEFTYDITPDLKITGGIRGYIANNSLRGFYGYSSKEALCFGSGAVVVNAPCTNLDKHIYNTGETHKVNLTWQVSDDTMLYGTVSTGFRPGGINRAAGLGGYDPDYLTNYEAGYKLTLADGAMHVNGALFAENWSGIQFSTIPPFAAGLTQIFNAGKAKIYGTEVNVDWQVDDSLFVTGGATYTDAELAKNYCQADSTCTIAPVVIDAAKGTQLPVTPRLKANLVARYSFNLADHDAHIQGALSYKGSAWPALIASDRAALGKMPAYTTFDLVAGMDFANFSLEAGATNLFDSHGQVDRYFECAVCTSQVYYVPIEPREVFIRLGEKF